jgi:hypothetical protein
MDVKCTWHVPLNSDVIMANSHVNHENRWCAHRVNTSVLPRVRLTALDEIIVLHFVNISAQHSPRNDMLKRMQAEDKRPGGTSAVEAAALNII